MFGLHTLINLDEKWHNEDKVIVQTDLNWGIHKTILCMAAPLQYARRVWNYSTYKIIALFQVSY